MTFPEMHLAGEAVAALIDGELSRGAYGRALDHMVRCVECRTAVSVQRQAKAALVGAGIPSVPTDLLSRLHLVPMTTDLSTGGPGGPGAGGFGGPGTLAVAGGEFVWAPLDPPGTATPAGGRGPRSPRWHAPTRHAPSRPRSYPIQRSRSVRLRRGLAGAVAGLAFGVVSAAAPLGSSGVSLQQPGVVNRGPAVVPAGVGSGFSPFQRTDRTRTVPQLRGDEDDGVHTAAVLTVR